MRRKNTSRRVHALSSDSIRSDEIATTDMALSRDWSRDGVSDMRIAVHDLRDTPSSPDSWPLGAAKSIRPVAAASS
jgi:signal transduction histidine kinase